MRKVLERNVACPVVIVRTAGHGHSAGALFPDGHPGRCIVADISIQIGIDKVLHRSRIVAQGGLEQLPILRQADFECGVEQSREGVWLERRPSQGQVPATSMGNDRAMACYLHSESVITLPA